MRDLKKEISDYALKIKKEAKTIAGTPLYEVRQTLGEVNILNSTRENILDYWTIPNPFKKRGQELCDLLIVFYNTVIIISDKWKESLKNIDEIIVKESWSSHCKKFDGSCSQLIEAKNWILENPQDVFFDNLAEKRVPNLININEKTKFILIAVTSGWQDIYSKMNIGVSGFEIDTSIKNRKKELFKTKNRITGGGDFIHSFEDKGFTLLMNEINNLKEIISYLNERERFFRDFEKRVVCRAPNNSLNLFNKV